jgi:putative transposase
LLFGVINGSLFTKNSGIYMSDSLELTGCIRVFNMDGAGARPAPSLIHHLDRGIQYCSNQFVVELKKRNFKISMTEENHCHANKLV